MNPTLTMLTRLGMLYGGLVLVGGWLWLFLRRFGPDVWRPPAALLGVVVGQFFGWYWSAHVNRGLFELWPILFVSSSLATLALAWQQRAALLAAARRPSGWATEASAGALSVLLFILSAWRLLVRATLSVTASNNDVASYANVARHLSHAGLSSPGSIFGFDLGHLARIDVYGEFNLLSLAQWLSRREVFEIAVPALAVVCALVAQILAALLRRSTRLPPAVVVVLAVLPQSTFLFTYIVTCYFGSQLLGLAMAMAATVAIFCHQTTRDRAERAASVACLTTMFVGLALTYAHMLMIFTPVAVGIALLRPDADWRTRLRLVAAVGLAFAGLGLLEPERLWFAVDRAFVLGRSNAGWPLPGVLPVALIGFQGSWDHTVTALTVAGSVFLVAAGCAAAKAVSRKPGSGWTLPATSMLALGLATYAIMYFGDGGPVYKQWKWISFLQPLLCLALLAPVAGFVSMRWRARATLPLLAALLVLAGANILASEDFRHAVDNSGNWVSSDLGYLGRDPNLADVAAVNVDLGPYWETMWAAVALAPRTTYLLQPTYYGTATATAPWTLVHRADVTGEAASAGVRLIGKDYALVRRELPQAGRIMAAPP